LLSAVIAGRTITHLDRASFWRRFGRLEHESLEFKASANNLREVIPAMAMTAGGEIVLGVTDKRSLAGCRLDQATLDSVMRRAQECGVEVSVEPLVVDGVPLTVVRVPRVDGRIVTTVDGRVLHRVGGDNRALRGEQLLGLLRTHGSRRSHLKRRLAAALQRLAPTADPGTGYRTRA
jgi:ATP-dependent DNA helicase RecG